LLAASTVEITKPVMDTNPFQSPQLPGAPDPPPPGADPRFIGSARQVPVVAVLMIVHGAFMCLAAVGYLGLALFISSPFFGQLQQIQQQNDNDVAMPVIPAFFPWLYGGLGGVMLIAGVLGIFAGVRNYTFRSRTLGIVALAGGMVLSITIWCAPLSLGLLIYGLIVYLGRDAMLAFDWQQARSRSKVA
jgi:hypothetical protein